MAVRLPDPLGIAGGIIGADRPVFQDNTGKNIGPERNCIVLSCFVNAQTARIAFSHRLIFLYRIAVLSQYC
jgi:hypothetical protein